MLDVIGDDPRGRRRLARWLPLGAVALAASFVAGRVTAPGAPPGDAAARRSLSPSPTGPAVSPTGEPCTARTAVEGRWRLHLVDRRLDGADLSAADLSCTQLQRVSFAGATLSRVRLAHSVLIGANLRRADLRDADLRGARLERADLTGANLGGADLTGARMGGAVVTGVVWAGATCPSGQPAAPVCPVD